MFFCLWIYFMLDTENRLLGFTSLMTRSPDSAKILCIVSYSCQFLFTYCCFSESDPQVSLLNLVQQAKL